MAFLWSKMSILLCFMFISSFILTGVAEAIENACNTRCTSYACVTNSTLCQQNKILSKCGCCHLCVKGNGELCGGEFGKFGVCGKGLRCTVSINKFLLSGSGPTGLCKPVACLRKCKRSGPVCGSNGFIFKNACEMKKFACLGGTKLTLRPLRDCIDNRHCSKAEGACNFVLQSSIRSNFHRIRRQSYGNCHGLSSCSRRYVNKPRCADNHNTYSNKCQRNIHGCILGRRLRWETDSRCKAGGGVRIKPIKLIPFGVIFPNNTIDTGQPLYPISGEETEYSGANLQTYNSSDTNSLT